MIKLIDILKNITEGKQVGDLYHFTYSKYIDNIKRNGIKFTPDDSELEQYKNKYFISTTRIKNPDFVTYGEYDVRITLDGNKISNKYKIVPINLDHVWGTYSGEGWDDDVNDVKIGGWFETRIISNTASYLSPIYFKNIENLDKEDEDFDDEDFDDEDFDDEI